MKRIIFAVSLVLLVAAGCRGRPSGSIELEANVPRRVGGCNVFFKAVYWSGKNTPFAPMEIACGAPEAALREKQWWGQGLQPGASSICQGDCIEIESIYYCATRVQPQENVILVPKYTARGGVLTPIAP